MSIVGNEAKVLGNENMVPGGPIKKRKGKFCVHGKRFCSICDIKKPAIIIP